MALDFNLLRPTAGPSPVSSFFQGQQDVAKNALAQEQATQARELNALRRQQAELGMQQTRGEIQAQEDARRKQAMAEKTAVFRDRMLQAPTPEAARDTIRMQFADPDLGAVLSQGGTLEQALARVPEDPAQFQTFLQKQALGMTEWMKSQLPKTVGNRVFNPPTMSYIEPPAAAPAPTAPVAVMGPNGRPVYVSREQAIGQVPFTPAAVKVMGGGAAPAAPAMPKAPAGYRYTPTGDLEAIPGGPIAAKRSEAVEKKESGKAQATDILDSLSDAYSELDRMKAIPSEQRGALSNVLSSVAASPVGQVAGRAMGTEAQTQRDVASSARLQLFAAVKNATGLSSQQLNSNVEFTTWLNSLTDPARGIETNKTILENMRKFVDSGGTYSAKQGGKTAPSTSGRPEGVGADWTLMTDKNNNKAWVSPDRKTFKEVK